MTPPPLAFSTFAAEAAHETWRFNCGPGALCGALGVTPEAIRPHLLDFESKGYTNPSLMAAILAGLQLPFTRVYECLGAQQGINARWPQHGLVRVQWSGPWTKPGVPVRVRYRRTHWVAANEHNGRRMVFDVNAISYGGWIPYDTWAFRLVPWLLKEVVPQADGQWWPTHCWELPTIISGHPRFHQLQPWASAMSSAARQKQAPCVP